LGLISLDPIESQGVMRKVERIEAEIGYVEWRQLNEDEPGDGWYDRGNEVTRRKMTEQKAKEALKPRYNSEEIEQL
jgi:hypothetical protein